MKRRMRSSLVLTLLNYTHGFQNVINRYSPAKIFRNVIANDEEPILDKTHRLLQAKAPFDERFDAMIRSIFPNAINNNDFEFRIVSTLAEIGFSARNTLLATSLCSDETAKVLSDDFVNIYGSNFNLGGLAGYPFAGNIGFQTMCGHIPDDGFCLFLFGPHVGVTSNGSVGTVERKGVGVDDNCCRSAIEGANYVIGSSVGVDPTNFMDLQQGAVQNMMLPLSGRLKASEYPMLELPYAIYESQNELIESIVGEGIGGVKRGIALLGGIQINTGPSTLDYFHPIRFDFINSNGDLVENMLEKVA